MSKEEVCGPVAEAAAAVRPSAVASGSKTEAQKAGARGYERGFAAGEATERAKHDELLRRTQRENDLLRAQDAGQDLLNSHVRLMRASVRPDANDPRIGRLWLSEGDLQAWDRALEAAGMGLGQ